MSACAVSITPDTDPASGILRRCGKPAVITIESGCVHEHVFTEDMCQRHAARMERGTFMGCMRCWHAGHFCRVIGRPLTAVTT